MREITVTATKEYKIYIGSGQLDSCGELIKATVAGSRVMLVSDDIVEALYADEVQNSLERAGYTVFRFVIKNGEKSKNAGNYISLLNRLAECRLTRTDVVAALGGGVVGDLAGFAAATYLRGVKLVQIPTTLLAAVDSSVGGKTAIDLDAGKNLAGAFYQPDIVICDTDTMRTLKQETYRDGCAEVIKYAVLANSEILDMIGVLQRQEEMIAACLEIKKNVVAEDEFDRGMRQLLNLGHTIGHAIEACSRYEITHGSAVAAGMVYAAKIATMLGICAQEVTDTITTAVARTGLPTGTEFSAEELFEIMTADKKRSGDSLNLVLPEKIGHCIIKGFSLDEVQSLLVKAVCTD